MKQTIKRSSSFKNEIIRAERQAIRHHVEHRLFLRLAEIVEPNKKYIVELTRLPQVPNDFVASEIVITSELSYDVVEGLS